MQPPEDWLVKVYDGDALVDLIFAACRPAGDARAARRGRRDAGRPVRMPVQSATDLHGRQAARAQRALLRLHAAVPAHAGAAGAGRLAGAALAPSGTRRSPARSWACARSWAATSWGARAREASLEAGGRSYGGQSVPSSRERPVDQHGVDGGGRRTGSRVGTGAGALPAEEQRARRLAATRRESSSGPRGSCAVPITSTGGSRRRGRAGRRPGGRPRPAGQQPLRHRRPEQGVADAPPAGQVADLAGVIRRCTSLQAVASATSKSPPRVTSGTRRLIRASGRRSAPGRARRRGRASPRARRGR